MRTKSFRHILKETNISYIVQQIRVLRAATKKRLTKQEWQKLKRENSLMAYSDLEDVQEVKMLRKKAFLPEEEELEFKEDFDRSYSP